mmetsp:Transcript_18923/g.32303  ORF Transcript_18923/g.32303 Transcript_18923/m.32303 type:complete len:290 (+) Transcript_18923:2529-3398(+)
MILQAHVGVGIAGKEGQQAARTADYAIGQFKFLKPLMFVHGREAYRRNSLLVLYSFYKNVLYVVAQFYFGFFSSFQGQPLYEKFIYQLYNVTMTSLPIMWFAVFDFEHEKDRKPVSADNNELSQSLKLVKGDEKLFMRNPSLYEIGMKKQCYSNKLMVQWIIYALLHALLIFWVNFYPISGLLQPDGKDVGFWVAGHVVYGVCVIVSNAILMAKFSTFEGVGVASIALMVFAYYFFFGVQSWMGSFPELSHLFMPTMQQIPVQLSMLLVVVVCVLGELAYRFKTYDAWA